MDLPHTGEWHALILPDEMPPRGGLILIENRILPMVEGSAGGAILY